MTLKKKRDLHRRLLRLNWIFVFRSWGSHTEQPLTHSGVIPLETSLPIQEQGQHSVKSEVLEKANKHRKPNKDGPFLCPGMNTGRNLSREPRTAPFPHPTHLISSKDNALWSPSPAPDASRCLTPASPWEPFWAGPALLPWPTHSLRTHQEGQGELNNLRHQLANCISLPASFKQQLITMPASFPLQTT